MGNFAERTWFLEVSDHTIVGALVAGWNVQMGNFIHFLTTFVAGFAIGFSSLWKLALVTLAVVPAIAMAGGFYAYTLTGLTSKSQQAYAEAGGIAEQVTIY